METRNGYGLLLDPTKYSPEEVLSLTPARLDMLEAWIAAESVLKDATVACDEADLRLKTAQSNRNEYVAAYGRLNSITFRDCWNAMKEQGR